MWKTRFEVSTNHSNDLTRHRNRSSRIVHHSYSRPLSTISHVREDSPSAIVRSSPPSSISNLEILIEEDEDIPSTNLINNDQSNLLLSKQNFSQIINNKYQIVLPTIIESNDHEHNQSMDDQYGIKLQQQQQDSFVAINTNNNQIINDNNENKEEKLNTNNNKQIIEFTLNNRIHELLQKKIPKQNKVREIIFGFATSTCQ